MGKQVISENKARVSQLDESNARLVAVREGIDVVVSGSVTRAGSGYKIISKRRMCGFSEAEARRIVKRVEKNGSMRVELP